MFLFVLALASCLGFSGRVLQRPTVHQPFVAAVVEYAPYSNRSDALTEIRVNLRRYERIVLDAEGLGAQIVVFPELGLTSGGSTRDELLERSVPRIPDPHQQEDECEAELEKSEVLSLLSHAARISRLYLVVNVFERVSCNASERTCPPDNFLIYNTNVAFNPAGKLVARYRKWNVYDSRVDRPDHPEAAVFLTTFGAKVGIMTCFDMLFPDPFRHLLLKEANVIAFPTAWYDEIPFLTALQVQLGWSSTTGLTLLASGLHNPRRGAIGSGIYQGPTPLNITNTEGIITAHVYSGDVPAIKLPMVERFHLDEDLSIYEKVLLDADLNKASVCHKTLCCTITYNAKWTDGTVQLVSLGTGRTFNAGKQWLHVQVCGVVASEGTKSVWNQVQIRGNFSLSFLMPTSLDQNLNPIPVTLSRQKLEVANIKNLLSIGIFARDFG